jgi:hypothetical protein
MKTYQSVLPAATRKDCRERKIGAEIKETLSSAFANGFWFCNDCQSRCERIEGENGQPSHCDRCSSPRIEWHPPLWAAVIDDSKLLHPEDLRV